MGARAGLKFMLVIGTLVPALQVMRQADQDLRADSLSAIQRRATLAGPVGKGFAAAAGNLFQQLGQVGGAGAAAPAEMTGEQVLRQSAAVYATLKQYAGTTTVTAHVRGSGQEITQAATAKITFARPDQVRIDGTMVSGDAFSITSDGKKTWVSNSLINHGAQEAVKNLRWVLTSFTGAALGAPAPVAAALMNLDHPGSPFGEFWDSQLQGREKIGDNECYKVVRSTREETVTYWIDVKTFLLRQLREEQTPEQLAAAGEKVVTSSVKRYSFTLDAVERPDEAAVRAHLMRTRKLAGDLHPELNPMHAATRQRLKLLGTALIMYAQDYGDTLPPMKSVAAAKKALLPYVKDAAVFAHPTTRELYQPNPTLSGKKLAHIPAPADMVAFYEARPAADGTRGVLYCDSHYGRVYEEEWPRLRQASGIPASQTP